MGTINGTDAGETLTGTSGDGHVINGNGGDDTIVGLGGNDTLDGGDGNDSLDGGDGVDTASYASATANVQVSLLISGPQNTGGAGTDTLVNIENLTGSQFYDTLIGDSGDNVLSGLGSDDTLVGGAGNNILDGGVGRGWRRL